MRGKTQVPDGWEVVRLGDVATMSQGGTPRKNRPEYWDGHIPFVTGADLTGFRIGVSNARSFLTTDGLYSGDTVVCEPGALLLATRTAVGLAGMATEVMGGSQDITCLVANGRVDSEYLCRALLRLAPSLQRKSRGTTIQGISREDATSLPILLPPLAEQRAIATVLDSIDEAIERTKAVIAATERLRGALLHELLSRGVPGWHSEWKEVPGIGMVPACWKVVRMEDVAQVERGKFTHRPRNEPRFYGGAIPFIQTGDVVQSNGSIKKHSQTLSEIGLSISRLFQAGTIVITIAANIGETAITTYPVAFPDSLVGITPTGVDTKFLEYFLRTQKHRLNRFAPESAQKNINLDDLRPMSTPIPSREEQNIIADMLDNADNAIEREREQLDGLQSLKAAGTDAILTGQVRLRTETLTRYG